MGTQVFHTLLGVCAKPTWIHRLHVVTKLVVVMSLSISVIMVSDVFSAIALLLLSGTMLYLSRVTLGTLRKYVLVFIGILQLIALSYTLITPLPGRYVLVDVELLRVVAERGVFVWRILITDESLKYIFILGSKFLVMIFTAVLLLNIVNERELIWGLRSIKCPYVVAVALALVFRGISLFINDFFVVRDAISLRGLSLEEASLPGKLRTYFYMLIPLFVLMIRRSYEVSLALEARGLRIRPGKVSTYYRMTFTMRDLAVSMVFVLVPVLFYLHLIGSV